MFYVSVTGLRTTGFVSFMRFWRHAIPSKMQADQAKGLVLIELRQVNEVHHTLTVWESKEAMLAYRNRGAHLAAMKVFRKIAKGGVYGYEATSVPTFDEALALWNSHAREIK